MRAADDHITQTVIHGDIACHPLEDGERGIGERSVQRAFRCGFIGGPVIVAVAGLPDTVAAVDHAVVFQFAILTAGAVPEAQRQTAVVYQVDLIVNRCLHVQTVCRRRGVGNVHHVVGQRAGVVNDAIDADIKAAAG